MDKKTISFLSKYIKERNGSVILSVVLSVASILIGFVPYFAVYKLLTGFFRYNIGMNQIIFWSALCMGGYLLKNVLFELSTITSHKVAYSMLEKLRRDLSDKLLRMPLGSVIDQPIGKLKNLIIDQVETIELPLAHLIPEGTAYIIAPLAVFIVLLFVHPLIAVASLISSVLGMIISAPLMSGMNEKYDAYMNANNHMSSTIVEYIEGIEVIKTFNQSETSYKKFTDSIRDFEKLTLNWFQSTWLGGNLMTAIMPTTLLGVLPVGLILYKSGSLEPEEIVLSIILSMALVGPIMGLTTYLNSLKMIKYAARSLDEVLEEKELQDTKESRKPDSFGIEFDNVSFAYHEDDPKVLDRLSFEVKSGKFTALIGPSGGGKSTVARLISRFWDVTDGSVKVGGINIKDISTADLSHYISYVAQDNYLFNCSLKENIRLGNPQASDEDVYAASKAAMCHDFIEKMDDGYDTQAGTAGNKLSGGEKQRIAIARMILRNAPIVVLDEATAYTDPENEEKIQTAISNLTKGKTLIVIAHRLSTIAHADNIIILNNGQINAQGTHEELLKNSKLYQSMWNAHIGAKNRALEGEN